MKQIKITKNEVETLRDFMFEERALSKALGRVERKKSNFLGEITDKYDLPNNISFSVNYETREILMISEGENEKKK